MYVSVLKVIRAQTPVLSSHILQLTSVPPRSRGPKVLSRRAPAPLVLTRESDVR